MAKNKREYDFNTQKQVGDSGEKLFLECYPECVKGDGIIADFYLNNDKVELKTDTWDENDTPNYFIEYQSDMKRKTPGSIWRAMEEQVVFFVYLYITNKTFYWFKVDELVRFMNVYIRGKKYKTVRNRAWITSGYTVPREDIRHLTIKIDNFSDPF